jgi:hypothetical protein
MRALVRRIECELVADAVRVHRHPDTRASVLVRDAAEEDDVRELGGNLEQRSAQCRRRVRLAEQVTDLGEVLGGTRRTALKRAVLDSGLERRRICRRIGEVRRAVAERVRAEGGITRPLPSDGEPGSAHVAWPAGVSAPKVSRMRPEPSEPTWPPSSGPRQPPGSNALGRWRRRADRRSPRRDRSSARPAEPGVVNQDVD